MRSRCIILQRRLGSNETSTPELGCRQRPADGLDGLWRQHSGYATDMNHARCPYGTTPQVIDAQTAAGGARAGVTDSGGTRSARLARVQR